MSSNPWNAKLSYAARGNVCESYPYRKNCIIVYALKVYHLIVMFTRAAPEPAHNNSCGPVPKEESGHPWRRQKRVTNATPQSKTSNISICLWTRLKSYRYCLNHIHKILHLYARVPRISPTEPRLSYSKYTNCLNLDYTLQPKVPEEEQNTQPAHHVFGFPFLQY